jgi:RND family efflux transporter MFP subunit
VTSVVTQPLAKAMRLPGELQATRDVAIHARVQGFVEKIEVDRGSAVKQGQLLVQLVAPEMQATCAEAMAKLASSEATYKRLKDASSVQGVVAGNDLDVAEKAVEADRARVRICQENQQYLRIVAPFDGVVTERNVHEGSLVGPSSAAPLVRLQEVSRLRLVVALPEVATGGVQVGEKVKFTVPAFPGVPFEGTVARVARALDMKTRSMPVELDVDNAGGKLAPGMFPEVQWQMKRAEPTLFVPPTAVVTTTERTFVIRVKDGIAEWVDVRPGVSTGALVEVFGALARGDSIALRGTDELRAGTKVTVKETK